MANDSASEATGEMSEEAVIDIVSALPGDAGDRERLLAHDAALRSSREAERQRAEMYVDMHRRECIDGADRLMAAFRERDEVRREGRVAAETAGECDHSTTLTPPDCPKCRPHPTEAPGEEEPVRVEDVWAEVTDAAMKAWDKPMPYNDSPIELIAKIIDERDSERDRANRAEAMILGKTEQARHGLGVNLLREWSPEDRKRYGLWWAGDDAEANVLRATLDRVTAERDGARQERDDERKRADRLDGDLVDTLRTLSRLTGEPICEGVCFGVSGRHIHLEDQRPFSERAQAVTERLQDAERRCTHGGEHPRCQCDQELITKIIDERDEARAQRDTANARLPKEMPGCTILFHECERGHGRLVGANWTDSGCPWCHLAAANARAEEAERKALVAGQDKVAAQRRADSSHRLMENERAARLQAERDYERLRDISLCRRQFPDGVVPGGTEECAHGWHDWYEKEYAAHAITKERLAAAEAERDAYRRAKSENDERFMGERDDARAERDEAREQLAKERESRAQVAEGTKRAIEQLTLDRATAERQRQEAIDQRDGLADLLAAAEAEVNSLGATWREEDRRNCQILGRALGYPEQPGGGDVVVGPNTIGSLCDEAAERIAALRARAQRLVEAGDAMVKECYDWPGLVSRWLAAKAETPRT